MACYFSPSCKSRGSQLFQDEQIALLHQVVHIPRLSLIYCPSLRVTCDSCGRDLAPVPSFVGSENYGSRRTFYMYGLLLSCQDYSYIQQQPLGHGKCNLLMETCLQALLTVHEKQNWHYTILAWRHSSETPIF